MLSLLYLDSVTFEHFISSCEKVNNETRFSFALMLFDKEETYLKLIKTLNFVCGKISYVTMKFSNNVQSSESIEFQT